MIHNFLTQLPLFLAQLEDTVETGDSFWDSLGGFYSGGMGLLLLILPLICLVHIIRHKQTFWWVFLVLFFPLVGSLLYIFGVMFSSGGQTEFQRPLSRKNFYQEKLRELQERLEQADTLDIRAEMGETYLQLKEPAKAKECFQHCLQGAYSQDPYFLYGLAQACYALQELPEALEAIEDTMHSELKDYLQERQFLQAKILDDLQRYDEALELYDEVNDKLATPESRYRHLVILKRLGHQEEADALLLALNRQILTLPREERNQAQEWLELAQKALAEL